VAHPNEELLRRQDDAFNSGDVDALFDTFTDDVKFHASGSSSLAGDYEGKDAMRELYGRYVHAMGESPQFETHDILANDDHGVTLTVLRATKGARSIEIRSIQVFHFREGKVSEWWSVDMDQAEADAFYDS
jgi:ketosteroid isomerase-like protein